mgnify:CR=1 FL=1
MLNNLIEQFSSVVIGGAMANTFLLANNYNLGKSLVEKNLIQEADLCITRSGASVLGELITYYFEFFESDPETQPFARTIASREQVKRSTGSWAINKKGEMTKLKDNDKD